MTVALFSRWPVLLGFAAAISAWFAYAYFALPLPRITALGAENGVIENVTVYWYMLAAVAAIYAVWQSRSSNWLLFAFFMVIAAMRELDMHSAFTTMSVLKSRFYVSPDVPVHEKLIGAAVILAILFGVWQVMRRMKMLVKKLIDGDGPAIAGFGAFGMMVFAKFLDSFSRLLPMLADWHNLHRPFMALSEESLEMIAAAVFALAPILYIVRRVKRSI